MCRGAAPLLIVSAPARPSAAGMALISWLSRSDGIVAPNVLVSLSGAEGPIE